MTRHDEIKARCEAATPGPWYSDGWAVWDDQENAYVELSDLNPNAKFIAHAREDIPFLLDQDEEKTGENARLAAKIAHLQQFRDAYGAAGRIIALYLDAYCDRSLPYDQMIADAARKAEADITRLTAERDVALRRAEAVADCLSKMIDVPRTRSQMPKWVTERIKDTVAMIRDPHHDNAEEDDGGGEFEKVDENN